MSEVPAAGSYRRTLPSGKTATTGPMSEATATARAIRPPVARAGPNSPVPAFRVRKVPSAQATAARTPEGDMARARTSAGAPNSASRGRAPFTFSCSLIVSPSAHSTRTRSPARAIAAGWPPSTGTARRISRGGTPVPQVRTVPSADTVMAHDASGAMAAAAICIGGAIDGSIADRSYALADTLSSAGRASVWYTTQ